MTGNLRRRVTRFLWPVGVTRRVLAVVCALLLSIPAAAAADDELERVAALAKGGALGLALRLLDAHQPQPRESDAWIAWERQRFLIYTAQQDWDAITRRVQQLPPDLPGEFVSWALAEAARTRFYANDAPGARTFLRRLLWERRGSPEQISEWRQLVIQSYLLENNVEDAHTALLRYKQDFRVNSPAWRVLQANILVRAGRDQAALEVLAGLKTYEARLLTILAGLRAGSTKPPVALVDALALARETRNKPAINYQVWVVASQAALAAKNLPRQIDALERALMARRAYGQRDRLFVVTADDLWQAYGALAELTGNRSRLVVGNDDDWVKKAESLKQHEALTTRAYYAFLAEHAHSTEARDLARQRLVNALYAEGRGEVVRELYVESSRYPTLQTIPDDVRYRLVDKALAAFEIKLAAGLMEGLERPAAGGDVDAWSLRRARVLIYAGEFKPALLLLAGMLEDRTGVDEAFAERYVQVIFDLQAADQHRQAVALLESLARLVDNARMKREILFWIADSETALGEHQQAAELYLRSATYEHASGGDMWGQTARFHAAEALAKAGLTADARGVYQGLLRFTEDPKQRAVIERNIQQLWLIENKATTR